MQTSQKQFGSILTDYDIVFRNYLANELFSGKTTLLKDVAKSILRNNPDMHLIILLIDERPEEVTDIREAICGDNVEVIYSTFDELPEHHKRVSAN